MKTMRPLTVLFCAGCLSFAALPVSGADFFVDPENGTADGDGSAANPWQSLQQVLDDGLIESREWDSLPANEAQGLIPRNPGAPVRAGDTILLASGDYGALVLQGFYNEDYITIAAAEGAQPRFSAILVQAGERWILRGLHVSPSFADPYEPVTMIDIESHNWQGDVADIIVEDCTLFSVDDASAWTMTDWDTLSVDGISADGSLVVIRNNILRNVNFGISVTAENAAVEGNLIENFAGDGLRGLGDRSVFAYNTVKNCYAVNANHDDGFQSWSNGDGGVGTGQVNGIVLRGNTIINYEDENQPFRGTLQGIGCFDGMFVDWVVENNVIITDHWHGITLSGAVNCRVVNNTVIDLNDVDPGPPWIRVAEHKDGRMPENCIVRNNLTTALNNAAEGVVEDHNLLIEDPTALFVDPAAHDLHLLETAAAVDAGSSDGAPALDRDRIERPRGNGVDIGAYEWHDAEAQPVDDTDLTVDDTDTTDDDWAVDPADDDPGCGCAVTAKPAASLLSLLTSF